MNVHGFAMHIFHSAIPVSITILIILIIKRIFKDKLSPSLHYSIWYILVLRILFIDSIKTPFSIFNLYRHFLQLKDFIMIESNTLVQPVAKSNLLVKANYFANDYAISMSENSLSAIYSIGIIIWLLGVAILSFIVISYNLYFTYQIKRKIEWIKDENMEKIVEECKQRLNVRKTIRIAQSDCFRTPILLGVMNPVLLFPKAVLKNLKLKELEYIILHELAHYKRKDIVKNWLITVLNVVHWFNPLVSYAFYKMRQDCEIACDAYVLARLEADEYNNYGNTIIAIAENISFSSSIPGIVGFGNKKSNIKRRIWSIAGFHIEKKGAKVKKYILLLILAGILLCDGQNGLNAQVSEIPFNSVSEQLDDYFGQFDGTFVLLNEKENRYSIHNPSRAKKRVAPLSTFKIIIALNALEEEIIKEDRSKLQWNGKQYPFDIWNQDHTLTTGMRYSVNWYFEQLSRDIGEKKIKRLMNSIDYGNKDFSGGIESIINGKSTLEISAIEQVNILQKIHNYEMPFQKDHIDTVKEVLMLSKHENAGLAGKTGTYIVNNRAVNGWFIGYVEKEHNVYYFALNLTGNDHANGVKAREIALKILEDKGIYNK